MEKENSIVTKKQIKSIALAVEEEIAKDYQDKVKDLLVKKRKQIRMMEITLERAKQEYEDYISGKKIIDEETYLFG